MGALLCRSIGLVLTAVAISASAAETYRFPAGRPIPYRYDLEQSVAMATAGDHLDLSTRITWQMTLEGVGEPAPGRPAEVRLAIQQVTVIHKSPGGTRIYDSSIDSTPDPAFVGYKAMVGATVTLTVDPATGRVAKASGGERLAAALGRLVPNQADPGSPSAQALAARTIYREDAIARLWTGVLALPAPGRCEFPTNPPMTGSVVRTWTGNAWTGVLDPPQQPVILESAPLAASGTLSGFTAQGGMLLAEGLPQDSTGTLDYTLTLTALTQPVVQRHHVAWTWKRQP